MVMDTNTWTSVLLQMKLRIVSVIGLLAWNNLSERLVERSTINAFENVQYITSTSLVVND